MPKFSFKVKAGQVVHKDRTRPVLDPDGKPTGMFEKRVYNAGDVIESDLDLAAKHVNKFELVSSSGSSDRRVAELEAELAALKAGQSAPVQTPREQDNFAVAPGGQVSSGFQQTGTPNADGRTVSKPISRAELEARGQLEPGIGPKEKEKEGATPARLSSEQLDRMTVNDLKEFAENNEIDLGNAHSKADIIKAIKAQV